jgi:YidC/Oxa1 family membrane protein insertase
MDDSSNKNLILAAVLSMLVAIGWYIVGPMVFPDWFPKEQPQSLTAPSAEVVDQSASPATQATEAETAATNAPRLTIDTPKLSGSISLYGGRIDDLSLKSYHETIDPNSPEVRLLSPVGEATPYYAVFAWLAGNGLDPSDVPDSRTEWKLASGATLRPGEPVSLTWTNTKGLTFARTIAIDEHFMFTVTDKVENTGTSEARLAPYAVVARHGLPKMVNNYVVHEGLIRRTDGVFQEMDYSEFEDLALLEGEGLPGEKIAATTDGWIGFTGHYWMTTLVPEQGKPYASIAKHVPQSGIYQAEIRHDVIAIAPGASAEVTTRLYAGAKEGATIKDYENAGIAGFFDSIDWGWFFFFTKPIFWLLHWLKVNIGNMGLAIIALTFVLKTLVLPLAYKSYVSMARMKELQPEMEVLKERAGDDKQKLQKDMIQLYKDKKVNPAAGCLPILIQIPIFFALFKVISVTLELRHAPFFGWLTDLSAPDTSSLFNLFGLLPWSAPAMGSLTHMIFIGLLPIILGITMWMQQKLNPAPTDPVQQQVFAWMPWVFMFMMSTFASGLIVYWITNNTITFIQQYTIMASHGKRPDIFENMRRKPKGPDTPPAGGKK